jgi:hypothetical protein
MSDSDFIVYPAFGFGAGIYCFFKGFKDYRNYRLMADTPLLPIRSLAMGRVEIYGTALGDNPFFSPVSSTKCLWYKVDIEKRVRDSKGKESWSHCATDIKGNPFYIDDTTAKVLVDPHGAESDLEVRRQSERSRDEYTSSFSATGGGTGRFRLTEYVIIPGEKYHVSGTCAENPAPKGEDDRNIILKGEAEPYFHISHRTEQEDEKNLRNSAFWYIFGGAALTVVCAGVLMLDWVFS